MTAKEKHSLMPLTAMKSTKTQWPGTKKKFIIRKKNLRNTFFLVSCLQILQTFSRFVICTDLTFMFYYYTFTISREKTLGRNQNFRIVRTIILNRSYLVWNLNWPLRSCVPRPSPSLLPPYPTRRRLEKENPKAQMIKPSRNIQRKIWLRCRMASNSFFCQKKPKKWLEIKIQVIALVLTFLECNLFSLFIHL